MQKHMLWDDVQLASNIWKAIVRIICFILIKDRNVLFFITCSYINLHYQETLKALQISK